MKIALSILIAVVVLGSECYATYHSITAMGQLFCNREPKANVEVNLKEHDTFDPDDLKNTTHSDSVGTFNVFGWEDEYGKVEFYIRIVHNCEVKDSTRCYRETDYEVPQWKMDKIYDMGPINLNLKGTKRDYETCNK
ncbi:transthyretin-like family domain-containing protein [Ditylenchus destructor]|uniref:Transthyretin-like family domain-containing protein n=1 Tax=Ditylenchus destructor TaxID=166010 RepID=A0AAD4NAY1_9BILA|nr:transthyretin-like family domain-containing protein [Ditylenchus destructor]